MLYALLGSGLLGALSSALLLWRKSVAETALAECRGQLQRAHSEAEASKQAYDETVEAFRLREADTKESLRRASETLFLAEKQRDEALDALTTPGSIADLLRMRMRGHTSIKMPDDPSTPKT